VIDAHVHHWDLGRFRYPWLADGDFEALRTDYLPSDYRADSAGVPVEGWVHVQAEVDHSIDPVNETAWVSALADEALATGAAGPLGSVVYADLRSQDLHDVLAGHTRYGPTRGVRQEAWFDPTSNRADIPREDLLGDRAWREGYRTLATFGLSFDLLA
jgi:predicted TIM-barrel fold metal-dependent hydrolase